MKKNSEEIPLITVAIPCYNHDQFVQDSIRSVINQDYKKIELIVIDDGSKDESVEKIREMIPVCEERFVRFKFIHRENKGLCATLNEALDWSQGEFFSPLASDDVALKNKVSFLVEKIEADRGDVVFGGVTDAKKRRLLSKKNKVRKFHKFYDLLIQENIPPAPASLMRKSAIVDVGGFDVSTKLEDWDMWLRLADKGRVLISYGEPVVFYRRHDSNITNNSQLIANERLKIINKYSSGPHFRIALRYASLQSARDFAESNKHLALRCFLQSRVFNKLSLFVIFKIATPKFLLTGLRKLLNE